jgi:hypothetical protein
MNIAEEKVAIVRDSISGLSGYVSNKEIQERVKKNWPKHLDCFPPTPARISKVLTSLGFKCWHHRLANGKDARGRIL